MQLNLRKLVKWAVSRDSSSEMVREAGPTDVLVGESMSGRHISTVATIGELGLVPALKAIESACVIYADDNPNCLYEAIDIDEAILEKIIGTVDDISVEVCIAGFQDSVCFLDETNRFFGVDLFDREAENKLYAYGLEIKAHMSEYDMWSDADHVECHSVLWRYAMRNMRSLALGTVESLNKNFAYVGLPHIGPSELKLSTATKQWIAKWIETDESVSIRVAGQGQGYEVRYMGEVAETLPLASGEFTPDEDTWGGDIPSPIWLYINGLRSPLIK